MFTRDELSEELTPIDSEPGARRDMFYAEPPRYQGNDHLGDDLNEKL